MPADLLVGDPGPEFEAVAAGAGYPAGGAQVRLKNLRGRRVVLFFHASNDTAGAREHACAVRDAWGSLAGSAAFFGVDLDSPDEHLRKIEQLDLPFPFLTDEDHRIARSYGLWLDDGGGGDVEGGESIRPSTFILDADGRVQAIWREGSPTSQIEWLVRALNP